MYTAPDGQERKVNVYPTLQFLYSHHVQPEYISPEVRQTLSLELLDDYLLDPLFLTYVLLSCAWASMTLRVFCCTPPSGSTLFTDWTAQARVRRETRLPRPNYDYLWQRL